MRAFLQLLGPSPKFRAIGYIRGSRGGIVAPELPEKSHILLVSLEMYSIWTPTAGKCWTHTPPPPWQKSLDLRMGYWAPV